MMAAVTLKAATVNDVLFLTGTPIFWRVGAKTDLEVVLTVGRCEALRMAMAGT
jgi:hypothetical protein